MGKVQRSGRVAVVCAAVAALSPSVAQAAPSPRPYVKDAGFHTGTAEFDFEIQYFLRVVLANMSGGGTVRICVSGVCRKAPASNRIFMNDEQFGQTWIARQTRSVVIVACNRAGCMRPLRRRLTLS
ncbi:MAG: hypothetical protein QOD83_1628 [Solirubrobacteraceae bacterium]|jgi:hypothetical protein|nr:hypothetical protein [Solirubrobacteraceae bacterium]